jgi:hypothetical protein
MRQVEKRMVRGWGERCSEYDPGCAACVAWELFDKLGVYTEGTTVDSILAARYEQDLLDECLWIHAWIVTLRESDMTSTCPCCGQRRNDSKALTDDPDYKAWMTSGAVMHTLLDGNKFRIALTGE